MDDERVEVINGSNEFLSINGDSLTYILLYEKRHELLQQV